MSSPNSITEQGRISVEIIKDTLITNHIKLNKKVMKISKPFVIYF